MNSAAPPPSAAAHEPQRHPDFRDIVLRVNHVVEKFLGVLLIMACAAFCVHCLILGLRVAWQKYGVALRRRIPAVDMAAQAMEERRQKKVLAELKLPPQVAYKAPEPEEGTVTTTAMACAICLEDFKDADKCLILPFCNHVFHSACITPWLIKKQKCPNCRSSVT